MSGAIRKMLDKSKPALEKLSGAANKGLVRELITEYSGFIRSQPRAPYTGPDVGVMRGARQNGLLFNRQPLAPGQVRKSEGWENEAFLFMAVSAAFAFALWEAKPNFHMTPDLWARQEALERQAARQRGRWKEEGRL